MTTEYDYPVKSDKELAEDRMRQMHEETVAAHDNLYDKVARKDRIFYKDVQNLRLDLFHSLRLRFWLTIHKGYRRFDNGYIYEGVQK